MGSVLRSAFDVRLMLMDLGGPFDVRRYKLEARIQKMELKYTIVPILTADY